MQMNSIIDDKLRQEWSELRIRIVESDDKFVIVTWEGSNWVYGLDLIHTLEKTLNADFICVFKCVATLKWR